MNFNDGWKFSKIGGEKKTVNVPHDAMFEEERVVGADCGINSCFFEGGDYEYEKTFVAQADWKGKDVYLEFEGVYHDAEVLLNGKEAGRNAYGYSAFEVKLDGLKYGEENTVKVIAHNAGQPNSRWYSGAGIFRPVALNVYPRAGLAPHGLKIETLSYENRAMRVYAEVIESAEVKIEVLDGEKVLHSEVKRIDKNGEFEFALEGCELWSERNPKLYTLKATAGGKVTALNFGIRTVSVNAKDGLLINGERVLLRGACIHHDNGLLGAISDPVADYRRIERLKKAGYNSIRSAHNPCAESVLDACDKLGIYILDEYVDMWYIHKTKYDYAGLVPVNYPIDLKAMVDKDFSRPSVIMYSIGNEVGETAQKRGIELTRDMTEYLHKLDSTRPVTCGVNIFFNYLNKLGFGMYSDKKADSQAKKKAVGSEFFNKLTGLLGKEFMLFGASLGGSDRATRDSFAELDVAGYNYGISRYKKDFKKYPDRVILGTETFCADAEKFMKIAADHPALIGDFVWAGMDYLGEVGIGSWEYRDYAPAGGGCPGWMTAGSGRLDLVGNELGEAAFTRVAFGLDDIRIASVPADRFGKAHSPSAWKYSDARESWSWNGCDGKETRVEVYSRAHKVALTLNGKKAGSAKVKDGRAVIKVKYYPGELKATAYDKNGKAVAETSLFTAGDETELRLVSESNVAEKGKLLYVNIRFTDSKGVVKPLERANDIKVNVVGGTLRALGSACPYYPRGYRTDTADTYYGEALCIVEPDGSGDVTVTAESSKGSAILNVACK